MPPALAIVMPYGTREDIEFALALAAMVARREIRQHSLPLLYRSGVRYQRDPSCKLNSPRGSCEPFKSPLEVLRTRRGDCDDLVPWRVAELQLAGEAARGVAEPSPGVGWHVRVLRGDGSIEDPSAKLGMR